MVKLGFRRNTTYGTMNDEHNQMLDPNSANSVCINGQLLLLDLIEKVEHLGEIININTDGVYMYLGEFGEESEKTMNEIKELAKEWEVRTGLELEWEVYSKLFQRDVNNYILVEPNGKYKSKGEVKKRSAVDNDLPIIAEALVDYCVKGTSVEDTINNCDELIKFQKVVKLTRDYPYALYGEEKVEGKVFRVFASNEEDSKGIFKVKKDNSVAKFGNTPEKCFIWNDSVQDVKCPKHLDKNWYIERANEKLADFLGKNDTEVKKDSKEVLLEVLNGNYDTLFDVLMEIKTNTNLTKGVLDKYIKVGCFDRYCKAVKASRYMNLFMDLFSKEGKGGKGVTYKKVLNDSEFEILKGFAEYNEEKDSFKAIRIFDFLKEIFNHIEDVDFETIEKLRLELDLFDDCSVTDDSFESNEIFIMNVNETKIPSVIAYSPKNGTCNFLKVSKEQFGILELKRGDLIRVSNFKKVGKPKVLGKDSNGINIVGEDTVKFDWWIGEYEIISRDYTKNKKLSEIEE